MPHSPALSPLHDSLEAPRETAAQEIRIETHGRSGFHRPAQEGNLCGLGVRAGDGLRQPGVPLSRSIELRPAHYIFLCDGFV
jgi:hypothetical protein